MKPGHFERPSDTSAPESIGVRCQECGYDLRGHEGAIRRCPECNTLTDASASNRRPPLRHRWGNAAVGWAVVGLMVMIGFRIVLAWNGLDIYELRKAAVPVFGVAKPGAARFVVPGNMLAALCFYGGTAGLLYSLVIGCIAVWRRDRRSATLIFIAAVITVVQGFLAFHLWLVIAGV